MSLANVLRRFPSPPPSGPFPAHPLISALQKTDKGISGEILFSEDGRRTHFHLEITELSKEGFKKIGTWDPVHGVNYTRSLGEAYDQIVESLQNKTFIVASRIGAPFLMWR